MTIRTWYHYRRESRLRDDCENGFIRPCTRFIFLHNGSKTLPDKARENALWGLQDPVLGNVEVLQKQAAQGEKLYLLKIETPPEHELYMADTGVFAKLRTMENPSREISDAVYDAYWKSLIPFAEYIPGQYTEPEVVSFKPIPLHHVTVQRIIEDYVRPPATFNMDELNRIFPEPD